MSRRAYDASAVLAIIKGKPLDRTAVDLLNVSMISAVNAAEVLAKVRLKTPALLPFANLLLEQFEEVVPFTLLQAQRSSDLTPLTQPRGLSFGDRACLALALEVGADVFTTDRAWLGLPVSCRIHLLR